MEYLILTVIIIGIVIYLLQYRKSQPVVQEPKHEEGESEVQNDNKSKVDETSTIISCKNPKCRQSLRIPVVEKRLKVTCPICSNAFYYPDAIINKNYYAYLDIETTSLNPSDGDLTVIGLYLENEKKHRVIQLIENEISSSKLVEIVKKVKVLYTYNGTRFDLPFIKRKLGVDLTNYCIHKDLMYECWRRNLYGGLKEVERKLGIKRRLRGIDGKIAVDLWYKYKLYKDRTSLTILLEYNNEDLSNLRLLRQKLNI